MRISDWSSDVCSSDLRDRIVGGGNTIGIWDNPQFQHMIVKYPDAAYLADLLSPPTSVSNGLDVPLDPAKVVAVFKVNQRNAPTQDIRGVDLGGNRSDERRVGKECVGTC